MCSKQNQRLGGKSDLIVNHQNLHWNQIFLNYSTVELCRLLEVKIWQEIGSQSEEKRGYQNN